MTENEVLDAQEQEPALPLLLIVEDDGDLGALLMDALGEFTPSHPLHVSTAGQALEAVASLTPSVFILDYRLPGMNGLELADRLRAITGLERVPILMLSVALPSRQALQQRGIRFLAKPFALGALLKAVEQLLPTPSH